MEGYPKGTVISWCPPQFVNKTTDRDKVRLKDYVPEGWAICDGKNDTPNLTSKFIMGINLEQSNLFDSTEPGKEYYFNTIETENGGVYSMRDKVSPPNSSKASVERDGSFTAIGADHYHRVKIANNTAPPPYYVLVYLIKL